MNKYELLYVVSTKLEEEKREELITRFANLVTAAGGEVEVSKWGVKKLAYPIKFQSEGYYVQMNYSSPEDLPLEIERQLRLLDYVLRFITVKKIENKLTIKAAAKKEAGRRVKEAAMAEAAAAEAAAETVAKETAAKETVVKDDAVKEPAVKKPAKEAVVKEAAVKDDAVKEPAVKKPAKEAVVKEAAVKDDAVKEPAVKKPAKEAVVKEAAVKDDAVKEPAVKKPAKEAKKAAKTDKPAPDVEIAEKQVPAEDASAE